MFSHSPHCCAYVCVMNFDISICFKLFCSKNYFGSNCEIFCDETKNDYYTCDMDTGERICHEGFLGVDCQTRKYLKLIWKIYS